MQVICWVGWHDLERQVPDLLLITDRASLYAAYRPMKDQTLETLRGWTVACIAVLGGARSRRLREGSGEVEAIRVSLVGVFGQRPCQHGVKVREIGSSV